MRVGLDRAALELHALSLWLAKGSVENRLVSLQRGKLAFRAAIHLDLPIYTWLPSSLPRMKTRTCRALRITILRAAHREEQSRSEERRVGRECRSRWSPHH